MPSFPDAKPMAKALRQALAERRITLSHSDCLEIVARQFGFASWNVLAARIEAGARAAPDLPEGWFVSHPNPAFYTIGLDPAAPGCAFAEAVPGASIPEDRSGVLMQSVVADPYRGGTLRLRAELAGEGVGRGTIWMRIDPPSGRHLRFDNMLARRADGAISGTTGWVERQIVLDVPEGAASIHFGFLLQGGGKLRARNFRLDVPDADIAVTGGPGFLPKPTNLDFSAPGRN